MKAFFVGLVSMVAAATVLIGSAPAMAQGFGYGYRDPADGDAIGWGPAFRPETTFHQPGAPPTPGEIAGRAYRARTGRGVYDRVEGPAFDPPGYYAPRVYYGRRIYRHRRVARAPYLAHRHLAGHPRYRYRY
jgi:hypothetical protein